MKPEPPVAEDAPFTRLARSMRERGVEGARLAIVLGSGLGAIAERLDRPRVVPFADLEEMPRGRVLGHASSFVCGEIAGLRVLVQAGRVHLYEGLSAEEVCRSVRAFAVLGIQAVLLTNSAGGLRPGLESPALLRIVDHLNLQGASGLRPREACDGWLYDAPLGTAFDRGAADARIALARGVYAGVLGPAYETEAEARMLSWMGADAVGMSTVCEAQAARASGLRVAAIACIANRGANLLDPLDTPLSHRDVLAAGAQIVERLGRLLEASAPFLASALP